MFEKGDIMDLISKGFEKIGYEIIKDLRVAKVNASDYSVPQNRERMIIVGVPQGKRTGEGNIGPVRRVY